MLDHTRFSIFCHLLPTSMVRALPRFTRIESCNYLFTKQLTKTEKMAIEIFFFFVEKIPQGFLACGLLRGALGTNGRERVGAVLCVLLLYTLCCSVLPCRRITRSRWFRSHIFFLRSIDLKGKTAVAHVLDIRGWRPDSQHLALYCQTWWRLLSTLAKLVWFLVSPTVSSAAPHLYFLHQN
jgi:hypothetical protein